MAHYCNYENQFFTQSEHLNPSIKQVPILGLKCSQSVNRDLFFSHGFALQLDLMGVVQQAVENGVGEGGAACH